LDGRGLLGDSLRWLQFKARWEMPQHSKDVLFRCAEEYKINGQIANSRAGGPSAR
jgi:hypothetical protein